MTTPIFAIDREGDPCRTVILGLSGQGQSVLLQAEARKLGIQYEELLQRLGPTEEQKEQHRVHHEENDHAGSQRLNAVREAFWLNTSEGHYDLRQLHDVLVMSEIIEDPTSEQIKAFYMMLPADIIGAAISWGFSDTEVRERTCEFAQQNKQAVLGALRGGFEQ